MSPPSFGAESTLLAEVMNMHLPMFSAEDSLYRSTGYQTVGGDWRRLVGPPEQ